MENKRLVIALPNVFQIILLIIMGITAFAVVLIPNSREPAIFEVYVGIEKVGFVLLAIINFVELMMKRGSLVEFLIYQITHVIWSIPVFYGSRWAEGAAILMGFAVLMIVWNAMGGIKGMWLTISNNVHITRPRLPSFRRNRTHPQEDEELSVDEDGEELV